MFKRFLVGLLILAGLSVFGGGTSAWAGSKSSGGSLYTCTPPGLDLNGDGIIDVQCSVVGIISWTGGFSSSSSAAGFINVTDALAICDNNGTAFKITLPGQGGIATTVPSAQTEFFDLGDRGKFDTIFHFPNRVDEFANLEAFLEYWFGPNPENPCKDQWTLVEIRPVDVELVGTVGSNCTDPYDVNSCRQQSTATYLCSTSNPLADQPLYTCSGPF